MPTLIFSECVLAYIERPFIEGLLKFLTEKFRYPILLDYDMFNPFDPFGKMMLHNFKQRGIPLVGMDFFTTLEEINGNYEKIGLKTELYSMRDMYYKHLNQGERSRIEKLEFLDELEEFWLVQEHYFMSLAKKSSPVQSSEDLSWSVVGRLKLSAN